MALFYTNKYLVSNNNNAFQTIQEESTSFSEVRETKVHIKRPMNAFMLFQYEVRPILLKQFPDKTNKEISVLLGAKWKSLPDFEKQKYYNMAKDVARRHSQMYPDYVYNPKLRRLAKAEKVFKRQKAYAETSLSPVVISEQVYVDKLDSHCSYRDIEQKNPDSSAFVTRDININAIKDSVVVEAPRETSIVKCEISQFENSDCNIVSDNSPDLQNRSVDWEKETTVAVINFIDTCFNKWSDNHSCQSDCLQDNTLNEKLDSPSVVFFPKRRSSPELSEIKTLDCSSDDDFKIVFFPKHQ